jgi:hypothetical protein
VVELISFHFLRPRQLWLLAVLLVVQVRPVALVAQLVASKWPTRLAASFG